MSFDTLARELMGDVPGLPYDLAKTYLSRALDRICDEQRWSFQVGEDGWLLPGLLGGLEGTALSPGTITVTPYSTTVQGDTAAVAAWSALEGRPFLTEMQLRLPSFSLYNIIGFDADSGTLTLDRPWMEPGQVRAAYMIYQAYFPVPVPGFRKFGYMRDMTNGGWLEFRKYDQAWLNKRDTQRATFDIPTIAVPYKVDQRPGSSTAGQMMYELYPHSLTPYPISFSYLWRGVQFTKPTDTVPYPLTEELVQWRAKEAACLWKEAQRGDGLDRGSGADWKFLSQEAHEQFAGILKQAKLLDGDIGDLYWNKIDRWQFVSGTDGYSETSVSLNNTMSVGF